MVHRREVEGRELIFGNHGALYSFAMTWWDHETGSVWSQPFGEAIMGPRTGDRLELLSSTLTTWGEWQQENPTTLALDVAAGTTGFNLDFMTVTVEIGKNATAFPIEHLRQTPVANGVVSGIPVAVVLPPGSNNWKVFARTVDGQAVSLAWSDGLLLDAESGRTFDARLGIATDGGAGLPPLPGFTSFEPDFRRLFPTGTVWQP